MYGQEFMIPLEYIVQIQIFDVITEITDVNVVEEILFQIVHVEEEHFVLGFHENVEKKGKEHGMINKFRGITLRLGHLFLCMTVNFSSIHES